MSELVVGSIAGLAANSYVVDVASGSTLDLSAGAVFPAGNVIQVVNAFTSTTTSTTSTSYVDTSLTATITPTSASSKIVVMVSCQQITHSNLGGGTFLRLTRGNASSGTLLEGMAGHYKAETWYSTVPASAISIDSPASTSPVTYTLLLKTDGASNTAQVQANQVMILMEVSG